jgi:hypothetical protein
MSSQLIFKEFVSLFKNWHIDATKSGRCLAEYLRSEFNKEFKQGELSSVDTAYWSKVLTDLKPIANNEYFAKYPRKRAVGSLGLGREQCKLAISNNALKFLEDDENRKLFERKD